MLDISSTLVYSETMNDTYCSKRTALILLFTGITGLAYKLLSKEVQERLLKIGYKWAFHDGVLEIASGMGLLIGLHNNSGNKPQDIYNIHASERLAYTPVNVYEAADQLEAFLQAAERDFVPREHKCKLDGLDVTITANDIKIDTKDLLDTVTREAVRIQNEIYGKRG